MLGERVRFHLIGGTGRQLGMGPTDQVSKECPSGVPMTGAVGNDKATSARQLESSYGGKPTNYAEVGLWIFGGALNVDAVTSAILGLSVLLITGVVTWKECLAEAVAWDTLMWFVALIAMDGYLNKYGLISWFNHPISFPPFLFNVESGSWFSPKSFSLKRN
ncbi:hypothetical protein NE237_007969 [Protea cynaroides]|uniref:Uncharacterized protein n=1 Tax=Protea cynaroides TaxID=273540 RepID=A0A9Q0KQH3_9MAGN|nr:hypothetical protein NE237_007969 [Protea cynaroides]